MKSSFLAAVCFFFLIAAAYSAAQPGVRWECIGRTYIPSGSSGTILQCEEKANERYGGQRGLGCCATNYTFKERYVTSLWNSERDLLKPSQIKDRCPFCFGRVAYFSEDWRQPIPEDDLELLFKCVKKGAIALKDLVKIKCSRQFCAIKDWVKEKCSGFEFKV